MTDIKTRVELWREEAVSAPPVFESGLTGRTRVTYFSGNSLDVTRIFASAGRR